MGLREQKKQQTREQIIAAAWQLFADQGFDAVPVTRVAEAAGVSTATVFNYFPTKEDLFFPRLEEFGERLVAAVADREPGRTSLDAVRSFVLGTGGLIAAAEQGDAEAVQRLRTINTVISDSPSLQAREERAIAGYTEALATQLASEAGAPADDIASWVTATALIGVQRVLIRTVRRRVLADDRITELATDLRTAGETAFALLERGLGELSD